MHFQAGDLDTCGQQAVLDRADDQMSRVQRNLAGTFALHLNNEAGFDGLHNDFVVQTQREAEAVESRTEVGAGRRYDGTGRQPDRQSLCHKPTR
ncbi:hypothetical protein MMOR_22100 [Mycolicibacterium moriokaense]|uniref:Uncharacterized protein n=1 Tax=Mycolicibacterium moriokaense TaxID=39691 RepID=A0AAD1HA41_9MYCO|nr:hypothetical protein MMOR_22100 [Mycolicibacterium moriokaense]